MNPEAFTTLFQKTLMTVLYVSAPMLLAGLLAGLVVSIFQAVTSIHEMTLTFIPKILAVAVAMMIFLPWILNKLLGFTTYLLANLASFAP